MYGAIHLADGFSAATREDWLALVTKTLKGGGPETLDRRTADGLTLHALYDSGTVVAATPRPSRAKPGWDIRATVNHPEAATAHDEILGALAGGATSVLVSVAARDHAGIRAGSAEDFGRLIDGVLTDIAPIALNAGPLGRTAAAWLDAAAKASPTAPLAFHIDPISAFATSGVFAGPVNGAIAESARLAARLADIYPLASLVLASGRAAHEAGGTPAQEIAMAAAAAVTYAKALTEAGLSMAEAWRRIVLGLAAEAEPLTAIPKLRAARLVWARLTGACGVQVPARIEARASARVLTRADAWTNLVRVTCAGFSAATGGADAIVLAAHSEVLETTPDAAALRLARNTQIILMEEAHLGRVDDPAGGAWAFEALTHDLARAAWERFTAIEAQGGLVAALQSGAMAEQVTQAREALTADLAEGRRRIVGVTDFAPADPAPAAPSPPDLSHGPIDPPASGPDSQCAPLRPIRLEDLAP
jgi:methylmalonyl-CoA mutase